MIFNEHSQAQDDIFLDNVSRRDIMSLLALSGASLIGAESAHAASPALPPADGDALIDRGFVRLREGLVHYRSAGAANHKNAHGKTVPLYMAHGGPGSSRAYEGPLRRLGRKRWVIAPDMLGYGDSAAADMAQPDVAYYADCVVRIMDSLGIPQIDFYGGHTGAHIGCELALHAPKRVRKVIFDGITLFSKEFRAELLANYAPAKQPDDYGSQLEWAWQFSRDMSLFFPHYSRDPAHRLANGVPNAQAMHGSVVDVLKALTTYHLSYNAVFRHEIETRLPLLTHPVMCIATESDPLVRYVDQALALIPGAKKGTVSRTDPPGTNVTVIEGFLDA